MKNFFFPQIFVPVIGTNDTMSSQFNEKNRLRTFTQPEDNKEFKHPNFAKTSRVKFLIQPPKTGKLRISLLGAQQQLLKDRMEGQEGKTRESIGKSFGLEESINQISKLEQCQNKYRISQTTKRLWQYRKHKNQGKEKYRQSKQNKENKENEEYKEKAKWGNKTMNELKKSKNKKDVQKIEQKCQKGLKKYVTNKVTKENKMNQKMIKQSNKKGNLKKKQKHNQQSHNGNDESLKSGNSQQIENSRIDSKNSTSKTKRRNGVQANIQLTGLQMTEQMKKILNINNRILGTATSTHFLKKTKHDLWARQDEDQNEDNNKFNDKTQPKEETKEICVDKNRCRRQFYGDTYCECQKCEPDPCQIQKEQVLSQINSNQDSDEPKGHFQKTCHLLDNKRPRQVRLHKRSYTIWDAQSNSSNEKDVSVQQKIQKQNVDENKSPLLKKARSNKKVRFMKTSTQIKREKNRRTQIEFPGSDDSRRSIKYKGVLHRNNSQELHPSIKDLLNADTKSKKIFSNVLTEQKKAPRLKKVDTQNVYNELNYFRMRLNLAQPFEQEIETTKNYPQNIHFSVEKLKNQSDYQRIQTTKRNNMMIDFGIKVTKDCLLNQKAARDKAVYNFY